MSNEAIRDIDHSVKKRRSKGKGRANSNPKTREERVESEMKEGKFNDPAWYTRATDLTLNAGNFSFNNAAGLPLSNLEGSNSTDFTVPGIIAATYSMIPGAVWDKANAPINLAARALYDKVNYKNSRNFSYDAPDLMMYVYGVSSCYALWAFMVRAYGVMNTYSVNNRYIPDALVQSMGLDPQELRRNMADFLYHINMFARRINTLPVPDDLPIFSRYMWMPSNVWADSESAKAGLFLYVPSYFWKYNEADTTGLASYLTQEAWGTDPHTLSSLYSLGDRLVEALLSSQDINNMGSDVLKAYEGKIVQLPGVEPEYCVIPQYSAEVLQQFHNSMRISTSRISSVPTTGSWTAETGIIHQSNDKGYIQFRYTGSDTTGDKYFDGQTNKLLDAFNNDPSPEDVFVMTRLMFTASVGTLMSAGTEVLNDLWIVKFEDDQSLTLSQAPRYLTTIDVDNIVATDLLSFLNNQSSMTFFTSAPLTLGTFKASTIDKSYFRIIGDVNNYTTISSDSIKKLHNASMLSLFSVSNTFSK